jgi:hypothetical protein
MVLLLAVLAVLLLLVLLLAVLLQLLLGVILQNIGNLLSLGEISGSPRPRLQSSRDFRLEILCVATCMSILACWYLCVATCLSCRYLIIYVCHLLVCCRVATCLGVEGIMCRRWCMALATDFCVWHICFYIYLCAFDLMLWN